MQYADDIQIFFEKKIYHVRNFKKKIPRNFKKHIPYYVKHLMIENYLFGGALHNIIPETVTHLTFEDNFDCPLKGTIPESITHLEFSYRFNQTLGNIIPKSVTHLTFGFLFNQPLDNCIPQSVTHLKLGYHFQQSIENIVLPNLISLIFAKNQPSPFNFPSLKHIKFGWWSDNIDGCIMTNVTHLRLGGRINKNIEIPSSVTNLVSPSEYNFRMKIPLSVTRLTILSKKIQDEIPPSVTHLRVCCFPVIIPSSVTHLVFVGIFNEPLGNSIPESVTHLAFGCEFDQPLGNSIPGSVTHLIFGKYFNQDLNGVPSSVTHLSLGKWFSKPLCGHGFYLYVKHLIISKNYDRSIPEWFENVTLISKDADYIHHKWF